MDPRSRNVQALLYGIPVVVLGGFALLFISSGQTIDWSRVSVKSFFAPACERPIQYTVGTYDERFGISRTEFDTLLRDSAKLWNDAAGKTVIEIGTEDAVLVNLVYSQHQRNAQLGKAIDAEQAAYEAKRDEVEALRREYLTLRSRYTSREAAFARDVKKHDEEVAYWNARGGAPPADYDRLQREEEELADDQAALNRLADDVNASVKRLNTGVDELNRLAALTNAKVGVYNEHAGADFDQGTYTTDEQGKRIDIYEFSNRMELKRVLAHEFGHALGLGHVENPESIMYSYNIGESFVLTEEDTAALRELCGVE